MYNLYKHLVPLWFLLVPELAMPKLHVAGPVKSQEELIVAQTESPAAANWGYKEYIFIVSCSLMTNRIRANAGDPGQEKALLHIKTSLLSTQSIM